MELPCHSWQMRQLINFVSLRGLEKVSAEWQLICLTHNLLKIWRRCCNAAKS